jgi:AcrR family transcriptional regulator
MGNRGSGSTTKPPEKLVSEQISDFVREGNASMKLPKADRRSKRTRKLLGDALVELMLEKHFERITVQDILDRADVGRSTFYAHYRDKEGLLMSEIEQVIHELEAYTTAAGNPQHGLLPSLELFRHVKEQRRLMRAFVWGRGAELLTQDFQDRVSKIIEQNIRSMLVDSATISVPLSVVASFVASTYLLLLRWWFDEDMQHTPEQMDEIFQKLVMPGLHGLMG